MAGINRRDFVRQVVWSSLGASLVLAQGACGGRRPARREPAASAPITAGRFFTAAEMRALSAACERLYPRDQDPGAVDLGVPAYIDRAMASDDFPRWRKTLRDGLGLLDDDARARFGHPFADAGEAEQGALLSDYHDAPRKAKRARFFDRLLHLTIEGAFGDPIHGGNRDGAGWKILAFAGDPCGSDAGLVSLRARR